LVADAVGASEPEAVVEAEVDSFGVVARSVEARELGVFGGNGPDVFGAAECAAYSSLVPCNRTVMVPAPRWWERR
jgi:hypothetical protein